ncbi:hypothetical protein M5K25_022438 [Dendrobium thyrsiflorum]|uniref:Monocopper oxidase-like protein SKU5 n=1 Tax=Dendrobium thyrsiflorum TaxID=117978 RepID=A0ABD0U671_DENTH
MYLGLINQITSLMTERPPAGAMSRGGLQQYFVAISFLLSLLSSPTQAANIFLDWTLSFDRTIKPVGKDQPVITINGMFPGPLINSTTNDEIYVNIFNNLDEPFLMTWNGIEQRLNSWQDGVSGTNCPILPGKNWTYAFKVKDQIGSFFYFPSINFHKAAGGFGPIRVNNRQVIHVPFDKPEGEFDLLIGDWSSSPFQLTRTLITVIGGIGPATHEYMLINGKGPYNNSWGGQHESIEVEQGKTYRLRISNVGTELSFNLRIQNHQMILVETEGSYTQKITFDSLDVHVGQSYSVLVTANQPISDYFIVAASTGTGQDITGVAVLKYKYSTTQPSGPLPVGPPPSDKDFSVSQAKSIRWNMTAGAARPNPQGTFNVTKVILSQTFILHSSYARIDRRNHFTVNNVYYLTPSTPLKLADFLANGTGVYQLDKFPVNSNNAEVIQGTFVASGIHKGWAEIVFFNELDEMNSWHLDGFGFYVVGFGNGEWSSAARETYNLFDPVVRSTIQVYPGGWSAVYVYLDNPGMWNLRSQILKNWYLGQELYVRVYDADPNPAKELPPPGNLLKCGIFDVKI